jgi:hypothetical protein
MDGVSIMIITHDVELGRPVQESIRPFMSEIFHAPNYPSFSKICNDTIIAAKSEIVIICSRKVRPIHSDITRMLGLLNEGYGLVALYSFAFFGFRKELIRRIGFFDERYVRGEYEDCDMMRRICEANIAIYEERSISYIKNDPTSWDNVRAKAHFAAKWEETWTESGFVNPHAGTIRRKLPEEKYSYDLGPGDESIVFKGREHSKSHEPGCEIFYRNIRFI